jgi:uncharacterized RDD family membrane protein YckC
MHNSLRFETPENVHVQYEPAGLGTRFLAWFVDQIVVWTLLFVFVVALLVVGISFGFVWSSFDEDGDAAQVRLYFVGLVTLVWGLGSFCYFGCCEFFLRGQTIGKRLSGIRVVKANGFQLDAASILLRNLFRVIDHLPPMWVIPVVSRRSQRAGDMVAGTVVVADAPVQLSGVREALSKRSAADAQFRFNHSLLKRLSAGDFAAIERVLDRFPDLPNDQKQQLLDTYTEQIAKKLDIELPPAQQRLRFLEDLFAAELRKRDRSVV